MSYALMLCLLSVSLQAQRAAKPFITGPCPQADTTVVLNIDSVVANPQVAPSLKSGAVTPDFPDEVKRPGYNGKVVVAFVVSARGEVDPSSVFIMSSTDPAMHDQ